MDSATISHTLQSCSETRRYFKGVYAANQLPHTILERPAVIIANLEEDFLPGSHWVAFYLPEFVQGVEYFDCLGNAPNNHYFARFIARNGGLIEFNDRPIQSIFSDVCGEFCCVYAFSHSRGMPFRRFISIFGRNRIHNDTLVLDLFNRHFTCNAHFARHTLRSYHNQSCSPLCHTMRKTCRAFPPPLHPLGLLRNPVLHSAALSRPTPPVKRATHRRYRQHSARSSASTSTTPESHPKLTRWIPLRHRQ